MAKINWQLLSILSVEYDAAKCINFDDVINDFAVYKCQ
jgi:hypothetical protein